MENKTSLRRGNSVDGTALEELVQCGICLEKLTDSRMLPCQHTFCLSCLQTHLLAKHYPNKHPLPTIEDLKQTIHEKTIAIKCPMCQQSYNLEKGFNSLEMLPKNLYIASLLKLIEENAGCENIKKEEEEEKCFKCSEKGVFVDKACNHCENIFCRDCYETHLSEVAASLNILLKQIENSQIVLEHKHENFENRCEQLAETVKETTLKKIEEIRSREDCVISEIISLQSDRKLIYTNLNKEISAIKDAINQSHNGGNNTFLHREIARIVKQVNNFTETRVIFDQETFQLDQEEEEEDSQVEEILENSSLESAEEVISYYKQKEFIPKLVWNKCPRPGNAGIPPWNKNLFYVTATDTKTVLIINRTSNKVEKRLTAPNMLFPYGIAFSAEKIYISDTWQHCIHVFSNKDEYLESFFSKGNTEKSIRMPGGITIHHNNLIIADTGNNRVLVVNAENGEYISTIGLINRKHTLNMPTSVASLSNGKIVIADSGNHRIKIFNLSGERVQEFGTIGRGRGQFRSAETVAVDPLDFILVGDSGNGRVQIFKEDGSLVKVIGKTGWVTGILVTKELEIVTTDIKARCLRIF